MALGGEANSMKKEMQNDSKGYSRVLLILLLICLIIGGACLIHDDNNHDKSETSGPTVESTSNENSVIETDTDSEEASDPRYPSPEEQQQIIEDLNRDAYEQYILTQPEPDDGFQDQPY